MIPMLGIDYDEPDPSTYRSVILSTGAKKEVFASGDPTVDLFIATVVVQHRGWETAMNTSSVDHFVMDGGVLADVGEADSDTQEKLAEAIAHAKKYLIETGELREKA